MKQGALSMTSGSLAKNILFFSLPLMITNLLQVLFNMADIAVVGRFAGSLALGSVGSTTTLVTLFTGFLIGIGSGVNALAARHYGAHSKGDLSDTATTSLLICLGFGILMLLIGSLGAPLLLRILNTKEDLIDGAVLYLRVYCLGMPALAIYNYGNAMLSAMGETRRPLFYLLGAGVLNVILNLFFVVLCHLSVLGVALASILSQYLSATLILLDVLRHRKMYGIDMTPKNLTSSSARSMLMLSVPAGLQNAIFQIANLFVQVGVNQFDTVTVAGNAAAINADALIYDVIAAFYVACSSFMAQNFGAGKKDRVLKSYFISQAYSFGAGMLFGLSLVLFGHQFLSLFTSDPAVAEAGMERLRIMGFCYGFSAFMDCAIAASRGLGKSIVPTIIVILGSCVFRVIWVYTIFAWFGTITSLYLLYIFSWIITATAEIIYFAKCYKQQTAYLNS